MKPVFIRTANVLQFLHMAGMVMENPDPSFGVVVGSAGLGKTECSVWYAVQNNGVYVLQDSTWTPRSMLAEIAVEYGGTGRGCSNTVLQELRLMALEQRRIIIIDEIDQVPWNLVKIARTLVDKVGVSVILIGEPEFIPKINKHQRYWSRCLNQVVEFTAITPSDISCFAQQACDVVLTEDGSQQLFKESAGDFRVVRQHMRIIERVVRLNHIEKVDARAITQALAETKGGENTYGRNGRNGRKRTKENLSPAT
jgi:DNA transposition AAA+ family ATPase